VSNTFFHSLGHNRMSFVGIRETGYLAIMKSDHSSDWEPSLVRVLSHPDPGSKSRFHFLATATSQVLFYRGKVSTPDQNYFLTTGIQSVNRKPYIIATCFWIAFPGVGIVKITIARRPSIVRQIQPFRCRNKSAADRQQLHQSYH
jgi:hypothetical protein